MPLSVLGSVSSTTACGIWGAGNGLFNYLFAYISSCRTQLTPSRNPSSLTRTTIPITSPHIHYSSASWVGSHTTPTRLRLTARCVCNIVAISPINTHPACRYQFYDSDNKAELSHELIAGAASYEAMKAYEEHCQKEGKPESHERAKEIIAGFAGAFIDRELETRGVSTYSRPMAVQSIIRFYFADGLCRS
jgi:hypothetical protein